MFKDKSRRKGTGAVKKRQQERLKGAFPERREPEIYAWAKWLWEVL